jgi:hypothetical protein
VADFDGDGTPEVVKVVASDAVTLRDADGTLLWSFPISDGGGGPPTIADFDGDGEPEVGLASRAFYRVIETDGTERWAQPVQDYSSSVTGSSVFDFEGDGAAEVVYADEETLWVYDGATGAVEMAWATHSSGTLFEYPLVVDVDNDGAAEVVVASNDYAFSGSRGITVIGDAANSWAPARGVWNQHAYFISNIGDDGAVDGAEGNWARWNSFRAGNSETAQGLDLADVMTGPPEVCYDECPAGRSVVYLPLENRGPAVATDVQLAVYSAPLMGEPTLLETVWAPVVAAGEGLWLGPIVLRRDDFADGGVLLVADGDELVDECNEDNNGWRIPAFPCDD